jgi:hypothetical protein
MKRFSDTIVCIGTGPSLTLQQIEAAREKGFTLFGCNLVYQIVPDLAVLFATNAPFWDWYWGREDGPREHPCEKWTNDVESAARYKLNFIDSRDRPGLSQRAVRIHHGHSSGYCLVNLAYLMGAQRIVLLGYDMKYAPDYNGRDKKGGSTPRHYFQEYPSALQHWPKVEVKDGVHVGLVERYAFIAGQNLVPIINCTPGSALTCFPTAAIEEL